MMVRVLAAAFLAAVTLSLWGLFYWAVLNPPGGMLAAPGNEQALIEALKENLPHTGRYYFPQPPREESGKSEESGSGNEPGFETFRERHTSGPIGVVYFRSEGADPLSLSTFLIAFLHFFASSLIAALLLVLALPALESFPRRVILVFGLGGFAALAMKFSDPVWWNLPWSFHLHGALFLLSGWLLAGLVMAWLIRPARGYTHVTDPNQPLWKRALDAD